jgi:phosphopantetheine--protein transferase-like protein
MRLSVGCDIVSIHRFRDCLGEGGHAFLERIFLPSEQQESSIERLAGLFAAKEAICKALSIPAGCWHQIYVTHEASGTPKVLLLEPVRGIQDLNLSISYDGNYAVAVVVATLT